MNWNYKIDFEDLQTKLDDLDKSETFDPEQVEETHNDRQAKEFYNNMYITMRKREIILIEIRKILDNYNIFKKYEIEDYQKANQQIHELLGMISA